MPAEEALESCPMFELALLSDPGSARPNNEDACGHWVEGPSHALVAVADGLGGYEGGEVASATAIAATLEAYRRSPAAWGPAKRLRRAAQEANLAIHNRALTSPELGQMATTLTALAVSEGVLFAVHAGDCRLYLVRGGQARQLTKDHTVSGELARLGLLSPQAALEHPGRTTLSRSLGRDLIVALDRLSLPLVAGDRLVLCSDGLYTAIPEGKLEELCSGRPEDACRRLVHAALRQGAPDNLTAAVLQVHVGAPADARGGWRDRLRTFLTRAD